MIYTNTEILAKLLTKTSWLNNMKNRTVAARYVQTWPPPSLAGFTALKAAGYRTRALVYNSVVGPCQVVTNSVARWGNLSPDLGILVNS